MPRKKGIPNKITAEIKELLSGLVNGEFEQIQSALTDLRHTDSFKYLQIMSKLLVFVIPKAVEEHSITINKPNKMSMVDAPNATKVAPITNSVAATCSPAYKPAKCFQP